MVIGWGDWPLMMTAGRRPFSIREMRAARAGSCACALDDCRSGVRTLERLAAESLGESEKEPEEAMPRNANTAVKKIRAFVVVDLMCDLMGANRTTFEDEEIRLVEAEHPRKNRAMSVPVICGRNR
jgi:hypothetical protein